MACRRAQVAGPVGGDLHAVQARAGTRCGPARLTVGSSQQRRLPAVETATGAAVHRLVPAQGCGSLHPGMEFALRPSPREQGLLRVVFPVIAESAAASVSRSSGQKVGKPADGAGAV